MLRKKKVLFDEVEEDNEDPSLSLNKDYATNYESWRRKEELNKSKAKYGNDIDEDSNSSSSSESEDDPETEVLDTNFFQALSYLKNNDPRIYDQNVKFFNPPKDKPGSSKKKEKPLYLRDYERKLLLETGGQIEQSDDEAENPRANSPTYVEEQRLLKDKLSKMVTEDDGEDDDWGGMFKKRDKTKEELAKEEQDYLQWLKGQKKSLKDNEMETELKPLKDYWGNPKLDAGEKFLRDYILNKKFIKDDNEDYIPSYEEIVHDSDQGLSEDEEAIRTQEEFETKYNYRYEEPDQEFIKRYPRTMENSVRKKDDRRKQKRAEIKQRKEEDKLRKKEDLQQLKALKRKEIEEKLAKLKEITGNEQLGFNDDDIDGDFDPDEHDKRMQQLFNEDFYHGEEGDQKPTFNDLDNELEIENWDHWQGEDPVEPHCEDEDFQMDCDYNPSTSHAAEMMENSGGRRKRKRKSKFAEVISQKKPTFDPSDKTYQEYLDEYYKLDYEDIIDDIPCRFKYRKVTPNDFGLSIDEILSAKDKELNKWCSLKKAIQIRPDHVEKYDLIAFRKKAENPILKKKILPSIYGEGEEQSDVVETKKNENSKDLKQKRILKSTLDTVETKESKNVNGEVELNKIKKKKKEKVQTMSKEENSNYSKKKRKHSGDFKQKAKKFKGEVNKSNDLGISDARLKAYGIKPKKFKNKIKYGDEK